MDDMTPVRGHAATPMRGALCKDCRRDSSLAGAELPARFEYSEAWAIDTIERGGSRSDRCPGCRRAHRKAVQALSVGYIDLQTIGEVTDREAPNGPLGGLGPLPGTHELRTLETDLAEYAFGMTDAHVLTALEKLHSRRILVLKAGTGTGKSTFGPLRLAFPPDGAALKLIENGPIVVTEPRVQATVGVARFVGEQLVAGCRWKTCSIHGRFLPDGEPGTGHPGGIGEDCVIADCSEHTGPGYPVGYQVAGDRHHDASCQIVYVTDGTMVNWLREGRLNSIGTVIIDEAHERSTNIDFILGFLKRELPRYPHLRVIVTSATFDVDFYIHYFGGPDLVDSMEIDAVKSFGYGDPLFPQEELEDAEVDDWLARFWPERHGPVDELGHREDLWATTRKLLPLRCPRVVDDTGRWPDEMPALVAEQAVRLVRGLDEHRIPGDILAFLPTRRTVEQAAKLVRREIPEKVADIYDLLRTSSKETIDAALAARAPHAKRKIVIASNLAETSLTVRGVRFIIDSGLIAQSEWDPVLGVSQVPTKSHSQSGIQQRWGRVGRDGPGWAFPLYTREQFDAMPTDTPPGSTRENQEQLIMKAKSAGIDDAADFGWPAAFEHEGVKRDEHAEHSMKVFKQELTRADTALRLSGAVDGDGHLTAVGRELERFSGSAEEAVAIMLADQLACVPETAVALHLLQQSMHSSRGLLRSPGIWPPEWRAEAASRHRGLAFGCTDDLDLVLTVYAAWEQADTDSPSWEPSALRDAWANTWWVSGEMLTEATCRRSDVLDILSPGMRQEVTRGIDLHLIARVRAVLSCAVKTTAYIRTDGGYVARSGPEQDACSINDRTLTPIGDNLLAFSRVARSRTVYLGNLVNRLEWAASAADGFELLQAAASRPASVDALVKAQALRRSWPIGARMRQPLETGDRPGRPAGDVLAPIPYGDPTIVELTVDEDESAKSTEILEGDLKWTGSATPLPDEDTIARRTVLDPRAIEVNDEDEDRGGEEDGPHGHAPPSSAPCPELIAPAFELPVNCSSDGCLLIAGYSGTPAQPTVQLERDWFAEGAELTPGNYDLTPGERIEVECGPPVTINSQNYRSFVRRDGGGRFLLASASASAKRRSERNELAVALDPNDVTSLQALQVSGGVLSATVLPTRWQANTVSLLPLLSDHLERAVTEQHVPAAGGSRRTPFWRATVVGEANEAGWTTVELNHRDDARGIRHRFGIPLRNLEAAGVEARMGTELLVRLKVGTRDRRALPVEDVESLLAPLVEQFGDRVFVGERREGQDLLPGRWISTNRPVVPPQILGALLSAAESHERRLEVLEWAMSLHFRQVADLLPCDGAAEHAPAAMLTAADVEAAYKPGAMVQAVVTSIRDELNRAWLQLEDGVQATVAAADVGRNGVLHISSMLSVGDPVDATVTGLREQRGRPQLQLAMPDMTTPSVVEQLAGLGVIEGAQLTGTVKNFVSTLGAFVTLDGGAEGLVHVTRLRDPHPEALVGQEVRVEVVRASADPRKPGHARIELRLLPC
jgi:HrpA-like RNA helicase/predicted RNA-binding protein with RPS1 domain